MEAPTTMADPAFLWRNEVARTDLFHELLHFFREGHFCDLDLVCSDNSTIRCHRLVVASVSSLFRALLTEDADTVHLPDHSCADVRVVVEGIYAMAAKKEVEPAFWRASETLSDLFDFEPKKAGTANKADHMVVEIKAENVVDCIVGAFEDNVIDSEDEEEERPKKRKRAPKRKQHREEEEDDFLGVKYEGHAVDDEEGFAEGDSSEKPKKRRVRTVKKEQPILKFDDPTDSPSAELYRVMKSANTVLNIRLLSERLDVSVHCNKKHCEASYFQALIGLSRSDSSSRFHARPLAFSLPDTQDITSQFDSIFAAFRELYGFSDGDVCYSRLLYSQQGLYLKNRSGKVRFELRGRYAKLFHEELTGLLENDAIVSATRRYPVKKPLTIERDIDSCELVLTQELEPQNLDGIALLMWRNDTDEVTGRVIHVREDRCEEESKDCMRALFDVWCIGRNPHRIPDSEYLRSKYNKLIEPMETYHVVKEFLTTDVTGRQRDSILRKEKQCSDCGRVFPSVTKQDNINFVNHKNKHYYENFKCDCNETFNSYLPKKNHVRLFHSGGRYAKCEQCHFVGTHDAMAAHKQKGHSYMCDVCGKNSKNSLAHHSHLQQHKEYKCEHCGETILSYSAFISHKRKFHAPELQNHVCEICGRKFLEKKKLKRHFVGVHMDSKDRPFQCTDCDRGFVTNSALAAHRMTAHIKSRPFQCRYGQLYGCAEAFNCNASRGTHEKNKHGERFHIYQQKLNLHNKV